MKAMKRLTILLVLGVLLPAVCLARAVRSPDMKTLMTRSELVFVGKVRSIKPSGITTELAYPTWRGVVFEWLQVEVEVIEPVKGTKKGATVRTLMLSTRGPGPMINAPGMVHPKVGQHCLLCLLPTKAKGVYASLTAPFDDDQAVFLLNRKPWASGTYYKDGRPVAFRKQNERNRVLWSLVDDDGKIAPGAAEDLRGKYKAEIATPAPKDAVVHLKWKRQTSENGWQWNVPDEGDEEAETEKDKKHHQTDGAAVEREPTEGEPTQ